MQMAKTDIVQLYRGMLRSAAGFKDYNFRSYALRRVKEEWQTASTVSAADATERLAMAVEQASMLQRQSLINSMYSRHSSVMHSYNAQA